MLWYKQNNYTVHSSFTIPSSANKWLHCCHNVFTVSILRQWCVQFLSRRLTVEDPTHGRDSLNTDTFSVTMVFKRVVKTSDCWCVTLYDLCTHLIWGQVNTQVSHFFSCTHSANFLSCHEILICLQTRSYTCGILIKVAVVTWPYQVGSCLYRLGFIKMSFLDLYGPDPLFCQQPYK